MDKYLITLTKTGGMQILVIILCALCIALLIAWALERKRLQHDVRTYRLCSEDQARKIRQLQHQIDWLNRKPGATPFSSIEPLPGSNVNQQQLDSMYFTKKKQSRE